jgi:hypothetical protein
MAAKTVGAVDRADVLIFVKSMIYIQGQLLTSFWDAKGITFTVRTLPSLVISAVRLGVRLAQFEHAKIAVRRPAHGKMLVRGLRIAQKSLQRIAVKQALPPAGMAKLHINLPVNFERLVHLIGRSPAVHAIRDGQRNEY